MVLFKCTDQSTSQNDPIVEFQDEFGRIRTAKKSEVPREYLNAMNSSLTEDDECVNVSLPRYFG